MYRRATLIILAILIGLLAATPVTAGRGSVQRIEGFDTVLAVRFGDDFPLGSLMRADCAWLVRVERPDGSAIEIMRCALSDEPVMVPEFQGSPPDRLFRHGGGACLWTSDYWWVTADVPVYASSFSYVVTPSGVVLGRASYPAQPLDCG